MECQPGDEVQVDFGQGAPIRQANGRMKRPHVFRMVLSFSRKAYSEAVWRQDTETFLRCLENAFHAFGGVPRTVVVDNLKAAVIHPDWYDPQLNPKLSSLGEHYGTVILPTRSYTPRHKGKVERQVGYVQDNGLKGRTFETLAAENTYLGWWEANVADQRIHGTTRRQVKKLFEEQEQSALVPLPSSFFPFFQEGERSVHRDGHIEVDKAYYSVPTEYSGHKVWVRYDSKLIRIFNRQMKQIAVHCKLEPGRFSTDPVHIHKEKICGVERGAEYHLRRARLIGPWSHLWAKTMLAERGIPGRLYLADASPFGSAIGKGLSDGNPTGLLPPAFPSASAANTQRTADTGIHGASSDDSSHEGLSGPRGDRFWTRRASRNLSIRKSGIE